MSLRTPAKSRAADGILNYWRDKDGAASYANSDNIAENTDYKLDSRNVTEAVTRLLDHLELDHEEVECELGKRDQWNIELLLEEHEEELEELA